MSTPSKPDSEPDGFARYAPKRPRDAANVERRELRLGEVDGMARAATEGNIRGVEKKSPVFDGFEIPRFLIPSLNPKPVQPPSTRNHE